MRAGDTGKKRRGKEKKRRKEKVRGKENGTWRKYLIGGTVTVHLAVTSGIPLPVCGETLQGSFTFSHRFSKMAHLTSRPNILSSVCLSLSLSFSPRRRSRGVSRFLSDSSEENDYSIPDGPLSIFVRLVNTGQGHGWIEAATNFVSVSTLGSTTHHHLLLLLLLPRAFPNFYYRQIDPISDYSPPPRVIRYRNRLHETRPRTTPSSAFLPSSLPSFARNMKKTGSWKIFSAARSLHFTSFGFFSFV